MEDCHDVSLVARPARERQEESRVWQDWRIHENIHWSPMDDAWRMEKDAHCWRGQEVEGIERELADSRYHRPMTHSHHFDHAKQGGTGQRGTRSCVRMTEVVVGDLRNDPCHYCPDMLELVEG